RDAILTDRLPVLLEKMSGQLVLRGGAERIGVVQPRQVAQDHVAQQLLARRDLAFELGLRELELERDLQIARLPGFIEIDDEWIERNNRPDDLGGGRGGVRRGR